MSQAASKIYVRHKAYEFPLKYPIIYAFNYPLTYYSSYGYRPLLKLKTALKKSKTRVIMMPNLTNPSSTIESRAQRFLLQFNKYQKEFERFHLVSHSFAGIDMRAMINFYDLQPKIASLSTLCSPHNGMTLLNRIDRHPEAKNHLLNALRPVGLNHHNVKEFYSDIMSEVNEDI